MNLGVEFQVCKSERKLPTVASAFSCQPCLFEFGKNLSRDFFGGIAIIGGEAVEDPFVPNPILKHLGRSFDKVTWHARARKARILCARQNGVHGMAKLVKESFHVAMSKEG